MILLSGGRRGFAIYRLDEDESALYHAIKAGVRVTSQGNTKFSHTLNRLRRNGLIFNHGSRANPDWKISETWKQKKFLILDLEDESFWNWV